MQILKDRFRILSYEIIKRLRENECDFLKNYNSLINKVFICEVLLNA